MVSVLFSWVNVYDLLLYECFHTLSLAWAQFSNGHDPAKFPPHGLHLLHVYTHQQSAVISETFPTGLAKGNKAGVQRNVKHKTVSLSCSLCHTGNTEPGWTLHFRCFMNLTICSRNVVVLHEQILQTLQRQFKISKTFQLNGKHV